MKSIKTADIILCSIRVFIILLSVLLLVIPGTRVTETVLKYSGGYEYGSTDHYVVSATIFDRMEFLWDIMFLIVAGVAVIFAILALLPFLKKSKKFTLIGNIFSVVLSVAMIVISIILIDDNGLIHATMGNSAYVDGIHIWVEYQETYYLVLAPTLIGCIVSMGLSIPILVLGIKMHRPALTDTYNEQTAYSGAQNFYQQPAYAEGQNVFADAAAWSAPQAEAPNFCRQCDLPWRQMYVFARLVVHKVVQSKHIGRAMLRPSNRLRRLQLPVTERRIPDWKSLLAARCTALRVFAASTSTFLRISVSSKRDPHLVLFSRRT